MRRTASLAFLAALAGAVALFPVPARADFEAGARVLYWFPDLSAKVRTLDTLAGSPIDARNDLGMKNENAPGAEAFLRFGRLTLRAGYLPLKYDGARRLQDNIVFHGRTFTVGEDIVSRMDLKTADLELQFDLLRQSFVAAKVNLGLMVKVKYVDGKIGIRDATSAEEKSFRAPIPMVGAVAGVGLPGDLLRLDARAAGVAYSGNRLVEGDACVSIHPVPLLSLQGGYKIIDFKVDKSEIDAKIRLKGPYAGAQLAF